MHLLCLNVQTSLYFSVPLEKKKDRHRRILIQKEYLHTFRNMGKGKDVCGCKERDSSTLLEILYSS